MAWPLLHAETMVIEYHHNGGYRPIHFPASPTLHRTVPSLKVLACRAVAGLPQANLRILPEELRDYVQHRMARIYRSIHPILYIYVNTGPYLVNIITRPRENAHTLSLDHTDVRMYADNNMISVRTPVSCFRTSWYSVSEDTNRRLSRILYNYRYIPVSQNAGLKKCPYVD